MKKNCIEDLKVQSPSNYSLIKGFKLAQFVYSHKSLFLCI